MPEGLLQRYFVIEILWHLYQIALDLGLNFPISNFHTLPICCPVTTVSSHARQGACSNASTNSSEKSCDSLQSFCNRFSGWSFPFGAFWQKPCSVPARAKC